MSEASVGLITWDGQTLAAEITTDHGPILCIIPRHTIHAISIYNDALTWEIERHKRDILDRLKFSLQKKIDSGEIDRSGQMAKVHLEPSDLAGAP